MLLFGEKGTQTTPGEKHVVRGACACRAPRLVENAPADLVVKSRGEKRITYEKYWPLSVLLLVVLVVAVLRAIYSDPKRTDDARVESPNGRQFVCELRYDGILRRRL